MAGPGTHLTAILARWLRITSRPGCPCRRMAARMDALGPEWSESDAGMAEILGVMRTEHAKRWRMGKIRIPFVEAGARKLVRLACRRARSKG